MDPLPQIPPTKDHNDTVCLIRNTFKENVENETFPLDIANNLRMYAIDDTFSLKETAHKVFGIYRSLEEESEGINCAEYDIIKQHFEYILARGAIEKNDFLKEMMKLKSYDIFSEIYLPDKLRYGMIQKCDLYPQLTRQFLDFRFNTTLHRCKRCFSKAEPADTLILPVKKIKPKLPIAKEPKEQAEQIPGLKLDPAKVIFKNFELTNVYEQTVKIQNISTQLQKLSIQSYPKLSEFSLMFDSEQKFAPGMYVTATVKFVPKTPANLKDRVTFMSRKGEILTLQISCHRDPPKLTAFVQKSSDFKNEFKHIPGFKEFSLKRQKAVNDTIDCGTCFATDYVLVSVCLFNKGNKAKFFWISEEEFCFQKVNSVSMNLELTKNCFWIYPTYFELYQGYSCEINILFQPLNCGLQTQTLYLMCDNNTYRQIELIGDGVCFNKNLISVEIPYHTKDLEKKKGHRLSFGHVNYNEISNLTLTISNRSGLSLKYSLVFEPEDELCSVSKWITVANVPPDVLAPYSLTDVLYKMECPCDVPKGYYNAKLMLLIKDIPIASIEADDVFLIRTNGKPLADITEEVSVVDVLLMEVEVACYVNGKITEELTPLVACESCGNLNCSCKVCKENIPPADLEFDRPFLEFGILPIGVDVQKDLQIINLSATHLQWIITELKYNIDSNPYLEVVKENNLSSCRGTIKPLKKHRVTYNIEKKPPARYVSILVLFLAKGELNGPSDLVAQNICVVSYEITELKIAIETGQSKQPILCPMQMLYTGVPVDVVFKIYNYSPISGCFYFLKPTGSDADKVDVAYKPQSGELNPGSKMKIVLKLTCSEVGILEDIYLPCFIGTHQEPIQLRLLCVVDCVHVFFYLPTSNNGFEKILWPPKVIYEPDYCACEEVENIKSEHTLQIMKQSEDTLNDLNTGLSSDESSTQDILKSLIDAIPELLIQDCVMEVRRVIAKEPKKITIYFENVTPKFAKYSVQSKNYPAKENNLKDYLGPKYEKTEDLWEPMIENYGIVVLPNAPSDYMKSHDLVSVDIWIYANTWGIYAEEILVDIENIVSFSFTLIIEIVGCPLQLPIGIGAITTYPTIRFGSTTYGSEPITRDVTIRNVSSIDLTVSWHVFYFRENNNASNPFNFICDIIQQSEEQFEFNFTERYFGLEAFDCIEVEPRKSMVKHGSLLSLPIVFKPQLLRDDSDSCAIKCFILGRIFPEIHNGLIMMTSNYLCRRHNTLVIEVTATLEIPRLDIEVEDDELQLYANDVAIKGQTGYYIKLMVRNPTTSVVDFDLDGCEPFSFSTIGTRFSLQPGRCLEICIPCIIHYERVLKWAPFVYRQTEVKELHPNETVDSEDDRAFNNVMMVTSDDKIIDYENKILKFYRKLFVYYKGGFQKVIPILMSICYPNIAVKPAHVKFGFVSLDRTRKATISVYNLTGCKVLFEVYKSLSTQELVVTPPHGEIEKSTGTNHSFTYITVYFTPTECKMYHESIRIMTNIPQHYIDVPIKGTGSINEKFN